MPSVVKIVCDCVHTLGNNLYTVRSAEYQMQEDGRLTNIVFSQTFNVQVGIMQLHCNAAAQSERKVNVEG